MKPKTLRQQYFRDVVRLGSIVLLVCLLVLTLFNVVEVIEHADTRDEELVEMLVLGIALLSTFPLVLWMSWRTSARLLRPLRDIQDGVRNIKGGDLDMRLPVKDDGDELDFLARSLNEAFDAHREAQRRLDDFSANVAHQLRTPLTALRSQGQVCLTQERSFEDYRSAIGMMLEQVERLGQVVDQLLLLAKVSAGDGEASFEEMDLVELTRSVLEEFQAQMQDRGVACALQVPEFPLILRGNRLWLREAMCNLLHNALVHAPDSLELSLTLRQVDGWIEWRIEDSGPGFPAELRENLFSRLRRGRSTSDQGSGLGLAIVAEVAKRHGGHAAKVESRLGGAGVELRVPSGC